MGRSVNDTTSFISFSLKHIIDIEYVSLENTGKSTIYISNMITK